MKRDYVPEFMPTMTCAIKVDDLDNDEIDQLTNLVKKLDGVISVYYDWRHSPRQLVIEYHITTNPAAIYQQIIKAVSL